MYDVRNLSGGDESGLTEGCIWYKEIILTF